MNNPTPFIRIVSAKREVRLLGMIFQLPHAEPGERVQLVQTAHGWQYQVLYEVPQSTFASPDPLRSLRRIGHADCTHKHSDNSKTSKTHPLTKALRILRALLGWRSKRTPHSDATAQGHASPSTHGLGADVR